MSKTKIIIINKQGAAIRKYKFHHQNQEIEVVDQYRYFGFTFTKSIKKHKGIENLLNKAWKTWFRTQKLLNKSKEKPVIIYLELLNTLVKPVVL